MQKTIYISDQALWDSIKAMTNGKSISRYLVDLHLDNQFRIFKKVDKRHTAFLVF